jgi:hypothetical protein
MLIIMISKYVKHIEARHYGNDTERKLIDNLVPSPSLFSYYILWGPSTSIEANVKYLNSLWRRKHT